MPPCAIDIRHLDARYRIARGTGDADAIARRLNRVAADALARSWERHAERFSADDGVHYFIERMTVNLALDVRGGDDAALANAWSAALHEAVLRAVAAGEAGVLVFRDRADYVAGFVEDLLRGEAWGRWHYGEFEPLRALPLGAAVLSALLADADAGRGALIELTRRGRLDLLLSSLSDAEVESIVGACLLPPSPRLRLAGTTARWVRALRALLASHAFAPGDSQARDVARCYLLLLRAEPGLGPDVNLARFVAEVLRLRGALALARDRRELLSLVEAEQWPRVYARLGRGAARQLLSELSNEVRGPEVAALLRELQGGEASQASRRVSTRFGGIFLLCREVAESGVHELLRGLPVPASQGASAEAPALFLLAAQALGPRRTGDARRDAGLALFAGLQAPPRDSHMRSYAEGLTPRAREDFAASFRATRDRDARAQGVLAVRGESFSARPEGASEFLVCEGKGASEAERGWDASLAPVSSYVLARFAARLGAFSESSAEYLRQNFLECRAEVELSAGRVAVRFLTCPLQMILRLAGYENSSWPVPWLEGRKLEFHFE